MSEAAAIWVLTAIGLTVRPAGHGFARSRYMEGLLGGSMAIEKIWF